MAERQSPSRGLTNHHSIRLTKGDEAFVELIRAELGAGKGEAIRTAIRVYAGILMQKKK